LERNNFPTINLNTLFLTSIGSQAPVLESDLYDEAFTFLSYAGHIDNKVVPVMNSNRINVFDNTLHDSIRRTIKDTANEFSFNRFFFDDTTAAKILASLAPDLRRTLAELRSIDGSDFNSTKILTSIRKHIIRGDIANFDKSYFMNALARQKKMGLRSVKIRPSSNQDFNLAFALDYAVSFGKILDHTQYTNPIQREKMRLYKALPSNILARLPVKLGDGTSSYIKVANDDTITIETQPPLPINDGWTVTIEGKERLPLEHEADHAYVLPNEVKGTIFQILSQNAGFAPDQLKLEVHTNERNANELGYATNITWNDHYVLKLDGNSYRTYRSFGKFFKEKYARYNIVNDADEIQNLVKFKHNHRVLPIDVNDPILRYITNSDQTDLYLTTFSTDTFVPKTNKKLPIIVENMPPYLIIVPTNTVKYNPNAVISKFKRNPDRPDRYTREIIFKPHFDPDIVKPRMNHQFFREKISYPNAGIDGKHEERAIELEYIAGDVDNRIKGQWVNDTKPTEIRKSPIREMQEIIKYYEDTFKFPTGHLTWFDVFARIPAAKLYRVFDEVTPDILDEMALGDSSYRTAPPIVTGKLNVSS